MNELVKLENMTALDVFTTDSAENLISKIESEVRSYVPDLKTDKSRKEIASLSARVSKSKVLLDNLGKDLVSEWKNKAKNVDVERKMIRDRLDSLRDEARKPLTEWENIEKAKIEAKRLLKEFIEDYDNAAIENDLFDRQKEIERKEQEQLALEEARLEKERKEKIESDRVEREKQIALKAVEQEKIKAEKVVTKEKEDAERKIIEARAAVEVEKIKAKEALEKAEKDKLEAINSANEKAEKLALEVENNRRLEALMVEKENEIIAAKEKKRQENKNHQKKVNNEVILQLEAIGVSKEIGKQLIIKIVKKEIKYLSINY